MDKKDNDIKQQIMDIFNYNKAEYEKMIADNTPEGYINASLPDEPDDIFYSDSIIDKTIKTMANNFKDTGDKFHSLSVDTLYSLRIPKTDSIYFDMDILDVEDIEKANMMYEEFLDDFISKLKKFLELDLSGVNSDELSVIIKTFNYSYISQFIDILSPNSQNLYDKKIRYKEIIRLAKIIVRLQINEIKNKKYLNKSFLELDLNNSKPFTYYMEVKNLKTAQDKLKILNNHITKDTIYSLFNFNIKDNEFLEELESYNILNISKLKLSNNNPNIDVVDKFLYICLLNLEIEEHYNKINRIVNNNLDMYNRRNDKINDALTLTQEILSLLAQRRRELDNNVSKKNSDIVEQMQSQDKKLDKAKFNTTLLSNRLFTGVSRQSGIPYHFSYKERKTKEDINTSITIYDSNSSIIQLNKEHRDINDAVGSLLDNGIKYLTLKQLYNFINKGIISNDPVEQYNLDELLNNLYKMDRKADIDATEQYNLLGYQDYLKEYEKKTGLKARPIISQNLINFKIFKNTPLPNGELIDIICFMDYPAIYDYARQYRQLAPYPVEILNLNYSPKGNKKDNTTQVNEISRTIRNELIRNIELRKSVHNQPLVINNFLCNDCQFYEVIDKDVVDKNNIHTKILNKQKRVRYTSTIEVILNNFKDKGYIKNYKINKLGKVNKYSITFIFNKDN